MADDITRDLRAWALRGAEQRLVEIAAEAAVIHRTFPELRDRASGVSAPPVRAAAARPTRKRPGRRGRNLSEEGRQRIADAARKRWAAWRAEKGEPAEASAPAPAAKGRAPKRR